MTGETTGSLGLLLLLGPVGGGRKPAGPRGGDRGTAGRTGERSLGVDLAESRSLYGIPCCIGDFSLGGGDLGRDRSSLKLDWGGGGLLG